MRKSAMQQIRSTVLADEGMVVSCYTIGRSVEGPRPRPGVITDHRDVRVDLRRRGPRFLTGWIASGEPDD